MKKRGFTLVELMGVIILIGIVSVLILPTVKQIIDDTKQRGYEEQINGIIKSAKNWGISNINKLPESGSILVEIDTLKKEGFIENKKIINPIDNKEITGCILITYNSDYNQYKYEYNKECILPTV